MLLSDASTPDSKDAGDFLRHSAFLYLHKDMVFHANDFPFRAARRFIVDYLAYQRPFVDGDLQPFAGILTRKIDRTGFFLLDQAKFLSFPSLKRYAGEAAML